MVLQNNTKTKDCYYIILLYWSQKMIYFFLLEKGNFEKVLEWLPYTELFIIIS